MKHGEHLFVYSWYWLSPNVYELLVHGFFYRSGAVHSVPASLIKAYPVSPWLMLIEVIGTCTNHSVKPESSQPDRAGSISQRCEMVYGLPTRAVLATSRIAGTHLRVQQRVTR